MLPLCYISVPITCTHKRMQYRGIYLGVRTTMACAAVKIGWLIFSDVHAANPPVFPKPVALGLFTREQCVCTVCGEGVCVSVVLCGGPVVDSTSILSSSGKTRKHEGKSASCKWDANVKQGTVMCKVMVCVLLPCTAGRKNRS